MQNTRQRAGVNYTKCGSQRGNGRLFTRVFPGSDCGLRSHGRDPYNFHGSTASTGGAAPLLIVSGPIVDEINMNAGVNLFGPGNRANATLGRAVRLTILNVFRMTPGIADKSTQGNPGKYSFCIAERADKNPWPGLNEEMDYGKDISSVTVFAGAGFCNVKITVVIHQRPYSTP